MSGHKKRKAATFSKKDCDYTIEFNENMEVVGKNVNDFTTWFGVHLKAKFPYYIPTDKIEDHKWEKLWMDIKTTWNINTDAPKHTLLKKAKKKHTNWRSYLTRTFVRKQEKPFDTYPSFLEEEHWEKHWEDFVTEKTSSESMAKSEKSSASANANINHNSLGRHGFANFDFESVWSQLLPRYSCLQNIQDERSKKWIASQAKRDKLTKQYKLEEDTKISSAQLADFEKAMIEDGSYFSGKEDPLTRLLGPEHGGRSRTTSNVIGKSKVYGGLFKDGKQKSQNDLTRSADEFGEADEQNITYHQTDKTTIENYEDEFVSGASVSTHDDAGALKELDMMFSIKEALVKQDINTTIQKIMTKRPDKIKSLYSRLTAHFADELSVQINVPEGMYPETEFDKLNYHIEYESMLQFLANGCLDASILHWCEMHLFTFQKEDTQVAFFNAQKITGEECNTNFASVKEHLVQVYKLHHNKKYFLAPFFHSMHWVLFIISPAEHKCWILDSVSVTRKKNKSDYPLLNVIEASFGNAFNWNMIKCKQQEGSWECGYLVIRNIFEFVISFQYSFPNMSWKDSTFITPEEIDKLILNIMTRFFISVFDDNMSAIKVYLESCQNK